MRWIIVPVLALAGCGRIDFDANAASAGYRVALSLDPAIVTPATANLPVLVSLDASRIAYEHAAPDGSDLRFTAADGTTLLPHEIERWDASGTSTVWVRSAGETTMWMSYGDASAPPALPATEVWADQFAAVWHLEDLHDSSGHGDDLTNVGGQLVAGRYAGALELDGAAGWARAPDDPGLQMDQGTSITFEAVIRPTGDYTNDPDIFRYDDCDDSDGDTNCSSSRPLYAVRIAMTGVLDFFFGDASQVGEVVSSSSIALDAWHTIAAVRSVSAGECSAVVDDATMTVPDISGGTWATTGQYLMIGRYAIGTTTEYFHGLLDELRVSTVARDAAWLHMDAASLGDALITYGPEMPTGS